LNYLWPNVILLHPPFSQLGLGSDEKFSAQPQRVKLLASERIKSVAVGWNHSLAITSLGELYQWGRLHEAVEDESKDFDMAIEMPGMRTIADHKKRMVDRSLAEYYANGSSATEPPAPGAAQANNGEALDTYGESNLNFGSFRAYIQRSPKLVEGLGHSKVVSASAGYGFSLIVTGTALSLSIAPNCDYQHFILSRKGKSLRHGVQ